MGKKRQSIIDKLRKVERIDTEIRDMEELINLAESGDSDLISEIEDSVERLEKEVGETEVELFLSGKYDRSNCIVTIHSGAGGTEACDWVSMLFRMYSMWAEKNGFSVEVTDFLAGDEAGYKSITFLVRGEFAYGYLKNEIGVHRLVRISPFDANRRRHTSFASVSVLPEIDDGDEDIDIKPEELRIDTFRASGAGGQYVNRTDSAVRITHLPTGIVVTCQNERSQLKNKNLAMKILKARLLQLREQEKQKELGRLEGDKKKIEWGSQVRSYILHPYKMVKDHVTGIEKKDIAALNVLDGELHDFIRAKLNLSCGSD